MRVRKVLFDDDYYHAPDKIEFFEKPENLIQREGRMKFMELVAAGNYTYESVACACGNDEIDIVTSIERHRLHQFVGLCTQCGLMRNNPRLDVNSYRNYYTSGLYRMHGGASVSDIYPPDGVASQFSRVQTFLAQHDKGFSQRRSIFEVGCNTGYNLYGFKKLGFEVSGLEPLKEACDAGNVFDLNIIQGELETFSSNKKYDIVMFVETFEHLMNPILALQRVHEIIKDDGVLFIGHIGILRQEWRDIYKFAQIAHPYNYCLGTLKSVAEASGFQLIYGTEDIDAIFRPVPKSQGILLPKQENYDAVLSKLKVIDEERFKRQNKSIKQQTIKIIKKFGLLPLAEFVLCNYIRPLLKRI